jgi:hypothetical protein
MARKCPNCNSLNVRRSSVRDEHGFSPRLFRSPYRCRECGQKFWVIGRRIYRRAGFLLGAVTAITACFGLLAGMVLVYAYSL